MLTIQTEGARFHYPVIWLLMSGQLGAVIYFGGGGGGGGPGDIPPAKIANYHKNTIWLCM